MRFKNFDYNIKIWDQENLGSLMALDTETDFRPFTETPDLITCQVYAGRKEVYYIPLSELGVFFEMHKDSSFITHNAAFDLAVLDKFLKRRLSIELLDQNKVLDTSILYRLLHLAQHGWVAHKFSLAKLAKEYLYVDLDKNEEVRHSFEKYKGAPISEMPKNFLEYGALDALVTYQVYHKINGLILGLDKYKTRLSHHIQIKGDWALSQIYKRGIEFDLEMRDKWLEEENRNLQNLSWKLANWGWVRGQKGNQKRYEDIVNTLGINLPKTEDGSVSSKREDLEKYSHIGFVNDYLTYHEVEKNTTFVRDQDKGRIHPRYKLLVNTGRTSCSKPNFQQLPREGSVRSMYRAKEGCQLIITDYSALELATLAQVTYSMFGESVMREQINKGVDLHRYYAAVLWEKEIKDVTKDERQQAKAANFGFPGGLGIDTFIKFSQGYGLTLSRKQAQLMKDKWFKAFPEVKLYLEEGGNTQQGDVYTLTGRLRANASYCARKNTPFQGLGADGAKLALFNLEKAGIDVVGFVHDEVVSEVQDNNIDKIKLLQEKIMIESMNMVVPDVQISVETVISKTYCK